MTLDQTLSQLREKVSKMIPAEAKALNDLYDQYQQAVVELVVVSPQSAGRAKKQVKDGNLKFNLLVDRIEMSGTIRAVKADPDYRHRPDPSKTLAIAKSLQAGNP
jgi:AhpC/TSA family